MNLRKLIISILTGLILGYLFSMVIFSPKIIDLTKLKSNIIVGEKIDMSGYRIEENNKFLKLSYKDFSEYYNNKKFSGTIILSWEGCEHCQELMPILNNFMNEKDFNVYYVNVDEILEEDKISDLKEKLTDYLKENNNGEKLIYTPMLLTIDKGVIVRTSMGSLTENKLIEYFIFKK